MTINLPIPENSIYASDINSIIEYALKSVDPALCVKKNFVKNGDLIKIEKTEFDLTRIEKIYLVGYGKAVLPMAVAISEILGDQIHEGVLIAKHNDLRLQAKLPDSIRVFKGSHPVPTEMSYKATDFLLSMLNKTTANDLVIGLISGGGSALLTHPFTEIGLPALQKITSDLLKSGASINEMNTIRKHLDQVKGGGLLKFIEPAQSVHLILSDVLGDPLSMIASGPTSADSTTFCECLNIIDKYEISGFKNQKVIAYLKKGAMGLEEETLKDNDSRLKNHKNLIIGSLSIAVQAAHQKALKLGFNSRILTAPITGEARERGNELAEELFNNAIVLNEKSKPLCLIAGGETTVTVKGAGKGGRNQELALSAALKIDGLDRLIFVSFATDGEDGPTDAAGGFVTGDTIRIGKDKGLDADEYLKNNNAYNYLKKVGGLVMTGPTGTNVNDIVLMIAI